MSARDDALLRLAQADFLRSTRLANVFDALDDGVATTRVAGGAVRDTLLGVAGRDTDVDLATELTPDIATQYLEKAGIKVIPTGFEHGTVTAIVAGTPFEITTLREDVETDGRHAVVKFGTDWSRDAARRDFTMNALYCDADGTLFDPLNGLDDCLAGNVRFIGDAATRITEDRLRVFRFFRFSASHGGQSLDADGLAACDAASGDLSLLAGERIGREMTRMLGLPQVATTLSAMVRTGVVAIPPERIEYLMDFETITASGDAESRMALIAGSDGIKPLAKAWRLSNAVRKQVTQISAAAELIAQDKLNHAAYTYSDFTGQASRVTAARMGLSPDAAKALVDRVTGIMPGAFPVLSQDLLARGISQGPAFGEARNNLLNQWIESDFTLSRDELLGRMTS